MPVAFQMILRVILIIALLSCPYAIIQYIKRKDQQDGRIKRVEREIVKLANEADEDNEK